MATATATKAKPDEVKPTEVMKEHVTRTGKKYQIPEKYFHLLNGEGGSFSAVIRAMSADGKKAGEIAKITGCLPQHARNVLVQQTSGAASTESAPTSAAKTK